MTDKQSFKNHRRGRMGVAGVIGGVIFMAILLSTVLVFFVIITQNDKAKATYEAESQQATQDKSAEKLIVVKDDTLTGCPANCQMTVHTTNQASDPIVMSKVLLYCTDNSGCPAIAGGDPNDPVNQGAPATLNTNSMDTRTVGALGDNLHYRVDVITERGNIVSTFECIVDVAAQLCIDAVGSSGPDFYLTASPSAFFMTPGSSAESTITVISVKGFSAPVTLSVSPTTIDGLTADIPPGPVTPPSGGSTLTIDTSTTTTLQTYVLSVTGTDGRLIRSTQVSISVVDVDVQGAVNEGIVQGTGSLQLDFRAFGAIFPQLGDRDGVGQKGWNVVTASRYGAATGYPAFEIPYQAHVFFVERMRNLDPAGEDITLTRKTALITNQGTIPSGQQSVVYICKDDPSQSDGVQAYNELTAFKVIDNTPINSGPTVGWEEVYFCTENPGSDYNVGNGSCGPSAASSGYCPEHTNAQLNGIIMVARGIFSPSLSQYGQTIPYQSAQPGLTDYTTFYWCLFELNPSTACPAPGASSTALDLIYTADRATMQGGLDIFAHYGDTSSALPNPGATITWIYPDGTSVVLADNENLVNQYIPISLPTKNSDGTTDIDCEPGEDEAFYIVKINDSFSSEGTRNVYYMTFKMTCLP